MSRARAVVTPARRLRRCLFAGNEADIIASTISLSCAIGLITVDYNSDRPVTAPLHAFCIAADVACAACSLFALILTHAVNNVFSPVHDINLRSAAKANLPLIWFAKLMWAPSSLSLVFSLLCAAARPIVEVDHDNWVLREVEDGDNVSSLLRAAPFYVSSALFLCLFPVYLSINAASLMNVHAGTFSHRPVLPAEAIGWSGERCRHALADLALKNKDLDELYESEFRVRQPRSNRIHLADAACNVRKASMAVANFSSAAAAAAAFRGRQSVRGRSVCCSGVRSLAGVVNAAQRLRPSSFRNSSRKSSYSESSRRSPAVSRQTSSLSDESPRPSHGFNVLHHVQRLGVFRQSSRNCTSPAMSRQPSSFCRCSSRETDATDFSGRPTRHSNGEPAPPDISRPAPIVTDTDELQQSTGNCGDLSIDLATKAFLGLSPIPGSPNLFHGMQPCVQPSPARPAHGSGPPGLRELSELAECTERSCSVFDANGGGTCSCPGAPVRPSLMAMGSCMDMLSPCGHTLSLLAEQDEDNYKTSRNSSLMVEGEENAQTGSRQGSIKSKTRGAAVAGAGSRAGSLSQGNHSRQNSLSEGSHLSGRSVKRQSVEARLDMAEEQRRLSHQRSLTGRGSACLLSEIGPTAQETTTRGEGAPRTSLVTFAEVLPVAAPAGSEVAVREFVEPAPGAGAAASAACGDGGSQAAESREGAGGAVGGAVGDVCRSSRRCSRSLSPWPSTRRKCSRILGFGRSSVTVQPGPPATAELGAHSRVTPDSSIPSWSPCPRAPHACTGGAWCASSGAPTPGLRYLSDGPPLREGRASEVHLAGAESSCASTATAADRPSFDLPSMLVRSESSELMAGRLEPLVDEGPLSPNTKTSLQERIMSPGDGFVAAGSPDGGASRAAELPAMIGAVGREARPSSLDELALFSANDSLRLEQ